MRLGRCLGYRPGHRAEDAVLTYGHIVLDEAQDLSPMELRMIARRSLNGSMTVVGDIAQATGSWAHDDWESVLEGLPDRRPAPPGGANAGLPDPGAGHGAGQPGAAPRRARGGAPRDGAHRPATSPASCRAGLRAGRDGAAGAAETNGRGADALGAGRDAGRGDRAGAGRGRRRQRGRDRPPLAPRAAPGRADGPIGGLRRPRPRRPGAAGDTGARALGGRASKWTPRWWSSRPA